MNTITHEDIEKFIKDIRAGQLVNLEIIYNNKETGFNIHTEYINDFADRSFVNIPNVSKQSTVILYLNKLDEFILDKKEFVKVHITYNDNISIGTITIVESSGDIEARKKRLLNDLMKNGLSLTFKELGDDKLSDIFVKKSPRKYDNATFNDVLESINSYLK